MINIKIDSRKVVKGDTFVAIKGANFDGHDFVANAIENGATKVVIDHDMDFACEKFIVDNTYEWLTEYIVDNYKEEISNLKFIGITGTNGKTTTAYLTYQLLNKLNSKTAYIGTIGYYLPNGDVVELENTTPNILDLYNIILEAKENGCQNIVMEVSSIALEQNRTKGITFNCGAFTNLTQDHLDYHHTMEEYLQAKMLLLKQLKGSMVVNSDDPYAQRWEYAYDKTITLGFNGKDYKIVSYDNYSNGMTIKFNHNNKEYSVEVCLKNKFNVYNYLTCLAICKSLGYEINEMLKISPELKPPKGRCEIIKVKKGEVVIDYAHTPDAVLNIITAFNEHKKGKIITVLGCGGNRDKTKRPIMGNIASENSDYVFITDDNPRFEDDLEIAKDMVKGITKDNYEIECNRHLAITKALDKMQDNDIVLLLGKGHEDYQVIGNEKVHFDDYEEVQNYIKKNSL